MSNNEWPLKMLAQSWWAKGRKENGKWEKYLVNIIASLTRLWPKLYDLKENCQSSRWVKPWENVCVCMHTCKTVNFKSSVVKKVYFVFIHVHPWVVFFMHEIFVCMNLTYVWHNRCMTQISWDFSKKLWFWTLAYQKYIKLHLSHSGGFFFSLKISLLLQMHTSSSLWHF